VIGNIQTKQAGVAFTVRLVRILNNAVNTGYNQAGVTVELYDASDNSGGYVGATACRSTWSAIAGTSQLVDFAAGVASASFTIANVYRDVRVHIVRAGAGAGEGCSSDRFAIRPQSLTVSAHDATWETAGTARALDNTSATSGNVHKASTAAAAAPRPFTLRATPVPGTATNYDGTPTTVIGYPACGSLCASAGSLSYTPASWSGTGTRENATAHYSEAGTFNLQLEDAAYASVDNADGSSAATRTVPSTATAEIGRFVPDHFDVTTLNSPSFRTFNVADVACSTPPSGPTRGFTYIGQPFGYLTVPSARVTARNAAGDVTVNYRGSLWKVGGGSASVSKDCTTDPNVCVFTTSWSPAAGSVTESYSYTLIPASTPNWDDSASVGAAATVTSNNDGTGDVAFSAAGRLAFRRSATTPLAPFTASITDTVSAQDDTEAGTGGNGTIGTGSPATFAAIAFDAGSEFRYGRARLLNASGPLHIDLPVVLRTEYYAAGGFGLNSADNCTVFGAAGFNLTNHQGGITAGNMDNTHVSISGAVVQGAANLRLAKPSPAAATPGSVRVCVDLDTGAGGDASCQAASPGAKPWLQGNWSGANYDRDPTATAAFGLYGSQPQNFIFFRENY
jgi:MSHA biogenesis protein MshQ